MGRNGHILPLPVGVVTAPYRWHRRGCRGYLGRGGKARDGMVEQEEDPGGPFR